MFDLRGWGVRLRIVSLPQNTHEGDSVNSASLTFCENCLLAPGPPDDPGFGTPLGTLTVDSMRLTAGMFFARLPSHTTSSKGTNIEATIADHNRPRPALDDKPSSSACLSSFERPRPFPRTSIDPSVKLRTDESLPEPPQAPDPNVHPPSLDPALPAMDPPVDLGGPTVNPPVGLGAMENPTLIGAPVSL